MFHYKRGIPMGYVRQGYIYFASRLYNELPRHERAKIKNLCAQAGGEYSAALLEFVTTDTTATAICQKYFLSRATLYRIVRKYYEMFPSEL